MYQKKKGCSHSPGRFWRTGENMLALEFEGEILVVDAGLMLPEEEMLGIDCVIPDISFLLEKRRRSGVLFSPMDMRIISVPCPTYKGFGGACLRNAPNYGFSAK